LEESYNYVYKVCIYEYNYTHTGIKKEYEIEKVLHLIPTHLMEKLHYKMVDLTNFHVNSYNNEMVCHKINEPIQRNWFFNDENIKLNDDDIIIDVDCDEIIYKNSYPLLINELIIKKIPLSIKLNQFFFKNNYLWEDCNFSSPTIYFYKHVKNIPKKISDLHIKNLRDLNCKTNAIYGAHMSWVMPIEEMVKKCYKTAHTGYIHLAKKEIMEKAVKDKIYIFDLKRPFNIKELSVKDPRIPKYLQKKNIFN